MEKNIKSKKLNEFESEEFAREAISSLLNECRERHYEFRIVINTLLEESIENTFIFSHSAENAGKLILNIFERALDKHLLNDETLQALSIELDNQEDHRTH
ncbi:hypothetical protein OAD09_00855 [Gammaproteobacteria bacterium]|jgi:hypothetical protein|nr:hypothetical protein [Gammaproteobacteria bacterium]MDB9940251.1 hypothetical protein [Gammaproteobacteria bacterium]